MPHNICLPMILSTTTTYINYIFLVLTCVLYNRQQKRPSQLNSTKLSKTVHQWNYKERKRRRHKQHLNTSTTTTIIIKTFFRKKKSFAALLLLLTTIVDCMSAVCLHTKDTASAENWRWDQLLLFCFHKCALMLLTALRSYYIAPTYSFTLRILRSVWEKHYVISI